MIGNVDRSGELISHVLRANAILKQDLGRYRAFIADKTEQKMFGSDKPGVQLPAFFVRIKKYPLGFCGQVKIGGLRHAVANDNSLLDLATDLIDSQFVAKGDKSRCYRLVLA